MILDLILINNGGISLTTLAHTRYPEVDRTEGWFLFSIYDNTNSSSAQLKLRLSLFDRREMIALGYRRDDTTRCIQQEDV